MSTFITFALEANIPEVDTHIDGQALAANMAELDELARKIGVRPLGTFVDTSAYADLFGEEPSEAAWMPADDVYRTVNGLLKALAEQADDEDPVVRDLRTLEKALAQARDRNVRFRMEISI